MSSSDAGLGFENDEVSSNWLCFQRYAINAVAMKRYESAEFFLSRALEFADEMAGHDPRPLITLAALTDLSEKRGNLHNAIHWAELIQKKVKLEKMPTVLSEKYLRKLLRLRGALKRVDEAAFSKNASTKILPGLTGPLAARPFSCGHERNSLLPTKSQTQVVAMPAYNATKLLAGLIAQNENAALSNHA